MVYNQFAKTYDKLMDKSLYPRWKQYVDKVATKQDTLLELACGTGDLSHLLEQAYQLIASDISEDMLVLAQQKLTHTPVWQVDMCDLSAFSAINVILCFADSLCYLPDENSLQEAFQQAYQALAPKGRYLFDVHSIYQMNTIFADYTYHYVDETTVFVWESFAGEFPNSVVHELTCCQQLDSGIYDRYDETHCQRTYPLDTYLKLLKNAGFSRVEVTANFGENDLTETTERWFFTCYKD